MMYEVDRSIKSFRRDVRAVAKRGYNMSKLERTITLLADGRPMPQNFRDHPLKGNFQGYRECHVDGAGDWLLVYKKEHGKLILVLTAIGTHADIFE